MENMKIEINEFQPVEEICVELERLGYSRSVSISNPRVVITWNNSKTYSFYRFGDDLLFKHPTYTTLEELKKMERN